MMTQQRNGTSESNSVSRRHRDDGKDEHTFEKWAIGLFGAALILLLGWLAKTVNSLASDVAELKTELRLTAPADVLEEVRRLRRETMTRAEIKEYVPLVAPWANQEKEWNTWRRQTDSNLEKLYKRLDALMQRTN